MRGFRRFWARRTWAGSAPGVPPGSTKRDLDRRPEDRGASDSVFRFCVESEYIDKDPATVLRTPKQRDALPDLFDPRELHRLRGGSAVIRRDFGHTSALVPADCRGVGDPGQGTRPVAGSQRRQSTSSRLRRDAVVSWWLEVWRRLGAGGRRPCTVDADRCDLDPPLPTIGEPRMASISTDDVTERRAGSVTASPPGNRVADPDSEDRRAAIADG